MKKFQPNIKFYKKNFESYSSSDEFDLKKRVQITNEVPPYDMFDALVAAIKEDTVKILYHLKVAERVERKEVAKPIGTNRGDEAARGPKINTNKKIYPNDPCPCGSGKKYKNCHGKNK